MAKKKQEAFVLVKKLTKLLIKTRRPDKKNSQSSLSYQNQDDRKLQ